MRTFFSVLAIASFELLAACGSGAGEGGAAADSRAASTTLTADDASADAPFDHVVLVMMENRSFDHWLGWLPGADGRQAGLTYPDRNGTPTATHPLAPDFQGCGHPDPDHSYSGGRVEYDGGACDGWLRAGSNDDFAIGYYGQRDLAFFGQAAPRWTVSDRYFAAILAETYPNRIYQHAAQTDRIVNTTDISNLPTIWDRLGQKGLRGRYYYSDVPFLALWGPKYVAIGRPFASFLVDAATGNLPEVAFVDPRFVDEDAGTSGDDHPHADIRNGELFLNLIYTAVTRGPAWRRTLLVINYDEWGGFFDHVPPPTAPIPDADQAAGNADGRLGFRTPVLLVAPWARRGLVSHAQYDHTSVLRLIEARWGLEPLTVRDATATNLADDLDFAHPDFSAPLFRVPVGFFGVPCPAQEAETDLAFLAPVAAANGWPVFLSSGAGGIGP